MIPNAGLDNIAAYQPWHAVNGLSGSVASTSGTEWLAYAAISEDSSTPSPSDTNIGSEAMRTNSTGGFNRTATVIRDTDANRLGVSIERAYVFEIEANLNITKYGYVPLSAGGNFSWIDLTREDPNDPGSTPVTLTLVPGDELQLWQTLTITVPWSVDLEQFVITGTAGNDSGGTHDAFCGFYSASADLTSNNNDGVADMIRLCFWPADGPQPAAVATPQAVSSSHDARLTSTLTGQVSSAPAVLADYVAGTYQRDKTLTFTTAQANMSITGIAIGRWGTTGMSVVSNNAFKVVFDDPATFEKDNLHALTLTFRVSWAEG